MAKGSLRAYRPADREVIADLADLAWKPINAQYREMLGEELFNLLFPKGDTRKGDEMRALCDAHPDRVWVSEAEGNVVAFISFWMDEKTSTGTLGNNAVHPDQRGQGIGREMYRAVLDHFRERGMQYARVSTGLDPAHAPARRAYERMGFNLRRESVEYFMKL